jgi:hypothetical protein
LTQIRNIHVLNINEVLLKPSCDYTQRLDPDLQGMELGHNFLPNENRADVNEKRDATVR